ncbi:hypothetical protein BDZ45DRAFT_747511 [Acephala macrosclerotiorum]|nr:hypothetical protein BDZ45DRAFT_747511 [Acephala macrosclerotiorum]
MAFRLRPLASGVCWRPRPTCHVDDAQTARQSSQFGTKIDQAVKLIKSRVAPGKAQDRLPVVASNFHRLEPIVPLRNQRPAKASLAIQQAKGNLPQPPEKS